MSNELVVGQPSTDISADETAQVDEKQEGLQTSSESSKDKSDGKKQDNLTKRINQLVGQRNEAKEELAELKARLQIIEAQKSEPKKKRYSDGELETAIKTAMDEGKPEIVSEAVKQMVKNEIDDYKESVNKKSLSQAQIQQAEAEVKQLIVDTYPEMNDVNSVLYQNAIKVYHANPRFKNAGMQGVYAAASQVYKVMAEEGYYTSKGMRNRVNKSEMSKDMAGDMPGTNDVSEGTVQQSSLDKAIAARNKQVSLVNGEIQNALHGKK